MMTDEETTIVIKHEEEKLLKEEIASLDRAIEQMDDEISSIGERRSIVKRIRDLKSQKLFNLYKD